MSELAARLFDETWERIGDLSRRIARLPRAEDHRRGRPVAIAPLDDRRTIETNLRSFVGGPLRIRL